LSLGESVSKIQLSLLYELKFFIFHIFGIFSVSLCFHVQEQLGNKKKTKMLSIHLCRFNCGELTWKRPEYKCHREDYFEVFYQICATIMGSVNSAHNSWRKFSKCARSELKTRTRSRPRNPIWRSLLPCTILFQVVAQLNEVQLQKDV